jgi:hypothetical protein
MKKLKLGFADTYDNAKKFFTDVLSRKYDVVRDDENPDYLIFGDSNFGETHYRYKKAKKIFFTGENVRPIYHTYDHAITFDHENSSKHYRLPLYVLEMWAITQDTPELTKDFHYLANKRIDAEREWDSKNRFCSYVQSNPNCAPRTKFVEFLIQENSVDSGGPHLNTMGRVIPRDRKLKIDFFNGSKFGIAFENGSYPGYVTEKLLDSYYANTIPVYWGSSTVARDFNPESFIDASQFRNFSELLTYMRELAKNKNAYLDMLTRPAFNNNIPNEWTNLNSFLNWFDTFVYEG